MKAFLFLLLVAPAALASCSSSKRAGLTVPGEGISGRITVVTGNRMPRVGEPLPAPKGLKTTVFVYASTNISQATSSEDVSLYRAIATPRIASIETDSAGNFRASLPPGKYSIFIQYGNFYYANQFDTQQRIAPVSVEAGKFTKVELVISVGASF